jgi:hypothetical protein
MTNTTNNAKRFSGVKFTTPPRNQGQMVTVSYGCDGDSQVLVERTQRPDGPDTYRTADLTDDMMAGVAIEPWNDVPNVPEDMWEDVD